MPALKPASSTDWRPVFSLAWPIILANLSQPLVGLIDTAVAGHLPHSYQLGAVNLGTTLVTLCCWLFGFLKMSSSGFTAQADGRKDAGQISEVLAQGLLIALAAALGIVLIQGWVSHWGLPWLGASGPLAQEAERYFSIRIFAAPAVLTNYVAMGVLIGLGLMRQVLYAQLLLNGTNLVLNGVFVYGFGWAVEGLAWAALVAEYTAVGYGLYQLRRYWPTGAWRRSLKAAALQRAMRVNRDIFLRTLLLQAVFTGFTAMGTRLGTDLLAANALLMSLLLLQAHTLDGFSHAAEVLSGRAYGQGNWSLFHQAVRQVSQAAAVLALALSVLFVIGKEPLGMLLTNQSATQAQFQAHYLWLAAIPVTGVACFLLDGIFIGITRASALRNAMGFASVGFAISASISVPVWQNHGLWLSLHVFMLLRAFGLYYYFRQLPPAQ